jgi:hypothetical protein
MCILPHLTFTRHHFTDNTFCRPIKKASLQVHVGPRSTAASSTLKRWRNPTSASKSARTLSSSCASSQRMRFRSLPTARVTSEVSLHRSRLFLSQNHPLTLNPSRSPRPRRQTRAPRFPPARPQPRSQRSRRIRRRKLRGRVRAQETQDARSAFVRGCLARRCGRGGFHPW